METKTVLAVAYEDLRFPASQFRVNPVTLKPDIGVFIGGVETLLFDPDADESVMVLAQMSHGWKIGTSITPHVHWSPATTDAGTVRWGLEYTIADAGGVFGATDTIYVEQASDTTIGKHQKAFFSQIDMSAFTGLSCMILMRLFRDANNVADTLPVDVPLLEFDIHYQRDDNGSETPSTKYS
jgi:hypothetical protein